jgi:hypothetical protein
MLPLLIEMIKEAQQKGEITSHLLDTLLFYLNALKDAGEKL